MAPAPLSITAPGRSAPALAHSAYAEAAARLGRPLTEAELRIDIVQADRDLAEGKRRLHAALDKEKRRVLAARLRGTIDRMRVTPEMEGAMRYLHERGRLHARSELAKIGVYPQVPREQGTPNRVKELIAAKLAPRLPGIQVRIERAVAEVEAKLSEAKSYAEPYTAGLDFGGLVTGSMVNQLADRIPGTLAAASDLISGGFTAGLTDGFDGAEGLISSWQYTAVMDDGTCDTCAEADGDEYDNLDDALSVLPDFGPNPDCDGGDRCRCRLVPTGATDEAQQAIEADTGGGAGSIYIGNLGGPEIIGIFDHTLVDEAGANIAAAQRARKGITQARRVHKVLNDVAMNGDATAVIQRDASGKLAGAANWTWRSTYDATAVEARAEIAGANAAADEQFIRTITERLGIDASKPELIVRAHGDEQKALLERLGFKQEHPGSATYRADFQTVKKLGGHEPPPEERPFAHYKDSTLTTQIGRARKGLRELIDRGDPTNPEQRAEYQKLEERLRLLERERDLRRQGIRPPGESTWEQPPPRNERIAELQRRYRERETVGLDRRVDGQHVDETGELLRQEFLDRWEAENASDTRSLLRQPVPFSYADATRTQRLLREILGEIRQLGEEDGAELRLGGDREGQAALHRVADDLPSDWFRHDAPEFKVIRVQRGHFSFYTREIALSGYGPELDRVALHELGHWLERYVPGIRNLESDLYEYRTEGDPLVHIPGYGPDEMTRLDRWHSAYMGKDYSGTAYEILSMGIDDLFNGSNGVIRTDPEVARLIFGILALL